MNWDDLRIFDAAAANGSLSAGAKALGMSQPQMSRRLRDLEDGVGVRLFDRTPQGLRPTAAGAKLIPLAENMRRAAEQVARAKPGLAVDAQKVVRISVDEIREHFLTTHLTELRDASSDLQLEVVSGHQHPDHESRTTDVQIRSCLPDSETLIARRVGQTGYGLYASRRFAEDHHCLKAGTDLSVLPWLDLSADNLWYPLQKNWLARMFATRSALRFNTMTAIRNAARHGHGLALLPHFFVRDDTELVEIPAGEPGPQTMEYVIVHRDLLREKAVRSVVDSIARLYKSQRDALAG